MRRPVYILSIILLSLSGFAPVHAGSESRNNLLITEIQTAASSNEKTKEYVEIYNPNYEPIDITGWKLQYRSSGHTPDEAWTSSYTKATLVCPGTEEDCCQVQIAARGHLVFARNYPEIVDAVVMSGGFSEGGGEIRLASPSLDNGGNTYVTEDLVGYGSAQDYEGSPSTATQPGESLKRLVDEDGEFIDSDVNANDFVVSATPNPSESNITFTCPTSENPADPPGNGDETDDPQADPVNDPTNETYLPLIITELFPDPASPQEDDKDEFVEIYNPNDEEVDTTGYALKSGGNLQYDFTFDGTIVIPAHGYAAITSADSDLVLSNSGTEVHLYDPAGSQIDSSPDYGKAKEGQSWMRDETGWHWSLNPTPGAMNDLQVPPPKTTAKTASTKKTTTKKASKAKAPSSKKTTPVEQTASTDNAYDQPANLLILGAIGSAALIYVIYEYRQDIARFVRKLRNQQTSAQDDD